MHTPGPWTFQEIDDAHGMGIFADENGNGERVAEVFTTGLDDARLIASAPDLLAACKALHLALCRTGGELALGPKGSDRQTFETFEAAITKAEGRS